MTMSSDTKNIDTNPLIVPILDVLKNQQEAISEYQLIECLEKPLALVVGNTEGKQLALFQTHFLVMNALYQLQIEVVGEGYFLSISPLKIVLQPSGSDNEKALSEDGTERSLAEFYLDWSNYTDTNEDDVGALLDGFWQRYMADDKQLDAYHLLELEPGADWSEIQKSYRRLASVKHPDRGGVAAEFAEIREAYEVLARVYGK